MIRTVFSRTSWQSILVFFLVETFEIYFVSPFIIIFCFSVNVTLGEKEDRILMTGLHTVRDLFCVSCESLIGWKYEEAYEESQRYKVGKFVIEKAKMNKSSEI